MCTHEGLLEDAVLSFDKAIECEPGPRSAPRLYNRAYLLRRMGRLQDAVAGFAAAMDLDVAEVPRCSAAIAEIEAQVREQAVTTGENCAPRSPESSPRAVAELAISAGRLYLCSCDELRPKWQNTLTTRSGVGSPKLRDGRLKAVTPPRPKHATTVCHG